jgi:hypothetical protein
VRPRNGEDDYPKEIKVTTFLRYLKHRTWLMVLPLLLMAYGANAFAAQTPSFSAASSGTANNLTLAASLNVADADAGRNGNIYLGFNLQELWFFNNGGGWVSWNNGALPIYATAPLANRTIEVVHNEDVSSLIGGQLYVGYGLNESDMLTNVKYGMVYTVTADTIAPTVTNSINANGATNVPINTKVGVTFSEEVIQPTLTAGNFTVKETTSGTLVAGTIAYTGVTAVFTPSSVLTPNTNYTVAFKGGANGIKDLAGNTMASDFVISWTTGLDPDIIAPTVSGTIHTNDATNVATNTKVGATFSEGMDPFTLTTTTFTLMHGTTVVPGTVIYSGVSAVFTPTSRLSLNTLYTVTVKGGENGAKDLAGNPLASDFTISWTTATVEDTTAPTVIGTINANGAHGVAINTAVGATFSEGMDPLTITNANFTFREAVSGTAVAGLTSFSGVNAVFTPASNLLNGLTYTATIKGGAHGVKDLAGNTLAGDFVWSWTTATTMARLAPVLLGTAGNFAILAKTGISTVPTSIITGDIGVSPVAATYITGFSLSADATNVFSTSPQVVGGGRIYAANYAVPSPANLTTAVLDMQNAYTAAAGRPIPDFTNLGSGTIGGLTLAPGLYTWGSSVMITTDVTISGGSDDVWIFQMSGDLIMDAAKQIILSGGAQAKNIFWQVAGQVTIGTTAHFEGIILSQTGITLQTGATMNGRALAQSFVALDSVTITQPAP